MGQSLRTKQMRADISRGDAMACIGDSVTEASLLLKMSKSPKMIIVIKRLLSCK